MEEDCCEKKDLIGQKESEIKGFRVSIWCNKEFLLKIRKKEDENTDLKLFEDVSNLFREKAVPSHCSAHPP